MSACDAFAQSAPAGRSTHGEHQVRRMLDDRFFMSAFPVDSGGMRALSSGDSIVKWAVAQYERTPAGGMVFWIPDPPRTPPSFLADHSSPSESSPGFLSIAKIFPDGSSEGSYIDFERLWMLAAFELLNIQQAEAWKKLDQRVVEGGIDKAAYVREAARIEYNVLRELVAFYREIWTPWAASAHFKTDPSLWRLDTPGEFDIWLKLYRDEKAYPWVPFEDRYEFFRKQKKP